MDQMNAKMQSETIIKTIYDDEQVQDFSEDSDVEVNFQPSRQKNKKKTDFDASFEFVSSVNEYNTNVWDDLTKYVKRKAKSKTDDKIKKARQKIEEDGVQDAVDKAESDVSLSDSEMKYDNIRVKERNKKMKEKENGADFFEETEGYDDSINFYQMNLSRPLMKAIGELKYVHPTPIQAATIPAALLGKDICGCAATGTGKTAAYMLPTLERLLYRPASNPVTRVLVLVPTRELGVQVYQVSKQLSQYTNIEIALAVGGLDLKRQETILRKNPDIVIATPGRLIDHLKSTPNFALDSIEILILDEADRMLDEYFAEQMKEIVKQCSRTRQTMLFSATMTDEVNDLAAVSLVKPLRLFVDSNKDVAFNLRQEFLRIRHENDREALLAALVIRTFHDHCIVFVQTKKQAHRLHILLGLLGLRAAELHGNLNQPQRLEALQKFKDESVDFMIATDVAARGLDIPGVTTVINFSMPLTVEHYIHRVGRTARAGRAGVSISLAGEQDRKIVKGIVKQARNPVKTRLIAPDIVAKYKRKLEQIEPQVVDILKEEYEDRLLSKMENRTNRMEKMLKGDVEQKRDWFQTKTDRKAEQERLNAGHKELVKDKKKKSKKKVSPEDAQLVKQVSLQARSIKKKFKPKRLNACVEDKPQKTAVAKKKSGFTDQLCNTSRKGTKNLRHEANFKQKMGGKKKKSPGKAFGKPQQKKSRA